MKNFCLMVSFYFVLVVSFRDCWWGVLVFNKSSWLGLFPFLCAMSEPHGSDFSATLIDECTSGQSFSFIDGSDNQFYSVILILTYLNRVYLLRIIPAAVCIPSRKLRVCRLRFARLRIRRGFINLLFGVCKSAKVSPCLFRWQGRSSDCQ